jgi:hypothetical protein
VVCAERRFILPAGMTLDDAEAAESTEATGYGASAAPLPYSGRTCDTSGSFPAPPDA